MRSYKQKKTPILVFYKQKKPPIFFRAFPPDQLPQKWIPYTSGEKKTPQLFFWVISGKAPCFTDPKRLKIAC